MLADAPTNHDIIELRDQVNELKKKYDQIWQAQNQILFLLSQFVGPQPEVAYMQPGKRQRLRGHDQGRLGHTSSLQLEAPAAAGVAVPGEDHVAASFDRNATLAHLRHIVDSMPVPMPPGANQHAPYAAAAAPFSTATVQLMDSDSEKEESTTAPETPTLVPASASATLVPPAVAPGTVGHNPMLAVPASPLFPSTNMLPFDEVPDTLAADSFLNLSGAPQLLPELPVRAVSGDPVLGITADPLDGSLFSPKPPQ